MMNELWTDTDPVKSLIKLHGAIDSCSNYAIKTLVVHPTDTTAPPPVSEVGKTYFRGLIRYAKSMNVDLAFENIERPEYLDTIFGECDDTNVRLCYDLGHENCFSKGSDVLGKYGERLKALHIHDNDGNSDQHAIPFDGNIDMDRFVSKLKELEYYGMITLEVMRDRSDLYDDLTDEQFLAKAFEAGKKLFEMRQG
jgi:sugar phosphate isomerase/epimerase